MSVSDAKPIRPRRQNEKPMRRVVFYTYTGAVLALLSNFGGRVATIPGIQLGSDKGGSTYGFDTPPLRSNAPTEAL